jgi:CRP-like cAMP-binding protein
MFGEIAFIDGMERSASAAAIGDCTLLTISRLDFIPFLEQHPKIAIYWLKVLCEKLRKTGDKAENIATLPVQARLARFLLTAAETQAKKIDEGLFLGWRKSQSEIGQEIAATRETVNIQLKQWEKKGIVKLGGQTRSITLLDSDALGDIADELT